jgi:hypothetical protein
MGRDIILIGIWEGESEKRERERGQMNRDGGLKANGWERRQRAHT